MKRSLKISAVLMLVALGINVPVHAQQGEWNFTAGVYLWATDLKGSSTIGEATVPLDIAFSDAKEALDSALTFHFEMQNDRWGWFADYQHIGLKPEGNVTLPIVGDTTITMDMVNNLFEVGGTYRLGNGGPVELLAGIRYAVFELDVAIGDQIETNVADEDWVDAFVGTRITGQLSERFAVTGRADIGAGSSDFVWNAILHASFSFNDLFSVLAGYRWLDYDYATGSGADFFAYDIRYEGPVIAAVFNW